jgi:hypothetical protein
MSFSAEWLSLREPADVRARNKDVLAAVAQRFAGREKLAVTDLAGGTGSTYRAVSNSLPQGQLWTLIDLDDDLLDAARGLLAGEPVHSRKIDLDGALAEALDIPCDLVVTSAFLDLVSEAWLDRLIAGLAARRMPVYAALSYDGRASCDPPHALDAAVISAVNRHQTTDKGFGPALGPAAAQEAVKRLELAGYDVIHGPSDWVFLPVEGIVQTMVIDGWAGAAREVGGIDDAALADWADWHRTRIAEGQAEITVGHVDLFAVPKA